MQMSNTNGETQTRPEAERIQITDNIRRLGDIEVTSVATYW